ncbi:hypothetical protein BGZ80_009524 [Entomortierella chlamydospora]|uniref:Uncharacterized protein n=1 Tax=Entomortierella chlamydospora TaxID=101097 RepID=A0A9P6N326_9FUNG|nr:hypothetical protein BGZ79_005949 [Entomortierella chlamydospora]KAG0023400.1 hypothetical protein BGZ80_009524 [Entomortierella chlamydospora]
MVKSVRSVNLDYMGYAIPALLTIALMPLSYSVVYGSVAEEQDRLEKEAAANSEKNTITVDTEKMEGDSPVPLQNISHTDGIHEVPKF